MRTNWLLSLLWLAVGVIYAQRGLVMVVTGQGALANTVPMLTALALAKLYEIDGDDL